MAMWFSVDERLTISWKMNSYRRHAEIHLDIRLVVAQVFQPALHEGRCLAGDALRRGKCGPQCFDRQFDLIIRRRLREEIEPVAVRFAFKNMRQQQSFQRRHVSVGDGRLNDRGRGVVGHAVLLVSLNCQPARSRRG